jgi:DNA-binding PucR family transcriptional regulator
MTLDPLLEGRPGAAIRARLGVADVASKVLLLRVSDSLGNDPDLLSRPLRTLQRHDLENHAGYLPTLAPYLRAFGAVDVAAQELRVHGNTVRYRLRQARTSPAWTCRIPTNAWR